MNESMNEWMNERTNEWINEWKGFTDERINVCLGGIYRWPEWAFSGAAAWRQVDAPG